MDEVLIQMNYLKTGVYHHVTGVDASSSASLAAYVNTLTYSPVDKQNKVVSGVYWSAIPCDGQSTDGKEFTDVMLHL
jgi:hypothetical protein